MGNVVSITHAIKQREGMETGYIKLYRSVQDCSFKRDPERFALWMHILLKASHRPFTTMLGGQAIELSVGQFVSGIRDLSDDTGVSFQRVRSSLDFFEKENMIARNKSRFGTVITVLNYGDFQAKNSDFSNTPSTHQNNTQSNTLEATTHAAFSRNATHDTTHQQHSTSSRIQETNNISITNVIDCAFDDENKPIEQNTKNANQVKSVSPENTESKRNKSSHLTTKAIETKFNEFYSHYPLKRSKGNAQKAFAKINPDDRLLKIMIDAIEAQKLERQTRLATGQFTPDWKQPATWLNSMCWEDEIQPAHDDDTPYQAITDLYNKILGDEFVLSVGADTSDRKKTISRLWIAMKRDLKKIEAYFVYFGGHAGDWYRGKNDNNWVANFDYICREDTITKARENTL